MPPLRGGIAHHASALAEAFLRRGDEVRALSYARIYPRLFFPGRREEDPASAASPVPVARTLTSMGPRSWHAGARAAHAFAPDLVVAAWWNAAVTGPVTAVLGACRARGARTVLVAHNAESHEARALDRLAWRALGAVSDGIVLHAAADRDRIARRLPDARVVSSPHPPYDRFVSRENRAEARRTLGVEPDTELVLFLGNIRPYKGADVALRAFAQLERSRPRARLVLAGEVYKGAREDIEGALAEVESGRARVLDRYLSDEEVARWLVAADVLVAPHRRASHSGVVQAARAAGLPVIASRVGGLPGLLPDTPQALVDPDDAPALAAMLDRFFEAPWRLRAPPPGAQREAWDQLASVLVEVAGL